jgi:hypothetical protein
MVTIDQEFDSSVASMEDASDVVETNRRRRLGLDTGVVRRQGQAGHLEAQQRQAKDQYDFLVRLSDQMTLKYWDWNADNAPINLGEWLSRRADYFAEHDSVPAAEDGVLARIGFDEHDHDRAVA